MVQCSYGRKPCQKAIECMRSFFVQAQLFGPFAMRRFDDLAYPCVPVSPVRRPGVLAVVARRGKDDCTIVGRPSLMTLASFKARVSQIGTAGGGSHQRRARSGKSAGGQKVLGLRLFLGIG